MPSAMTYPALGRAGWLCLADPAAYIGGMKTTRAYIAAALAFFCSGFGPCAQEQDIPPLSVYGFTMLSPPTNLFAPGAIVIMQEDEMGRAQLKLLCGPRSNLGSGFLPRVSETMSSTLKMSRSQKVTLEADAVERFRSRTQVEEVESVSVVFSNARVLQLSEDEVASGVVNRTPACQQAIDTRLANGFTPTYVTSSYIADVEYIVSFKNDASVSKVIKEQRMGRIAANLGGGHTEITEHALRALNLGLAVKLDSYLMQLKPDGHFQPTPQDPKNMYPAPFAEALPGSDAPLVPPAGGWPNPVIGG